MTPKRHETNFVNNQPVRFYKFIALTFLLVTIVLFVVIIFMSAKEAVITITTKNDPIEANKYVVIGSSGEWSGIATSTQVSLEKEFNSIGTKEELGVAKGMVILVNETEYDQPLIATTRLLTPEGILFRLKNRVLVPAGGEIEAEVYADVEGSSGNIGPVEKFTIPGLRDETQKVIYAKSEAPMTGGIKVIGVLSVADVKKAESELSKLLEENGKSILSALYPDTKKVYKIVEQSFENDSEIGKEISGFNISGEMTLVAVFYNEADVEMTAKELLAKRMVGDVDVLGENINNSVVLDSYDLEVGTAVLQIFSNGVVKLNPESAQLDKNIFYGKTKDEVRRYLLSLDHVSGVDIKFSPAWMRTVPHVAEHVKVVVQEVE